MDDSLRPPRWRALILIAVAASVLALLIYLLQGMPSVVDLGLYLAPIKATSLDAQPIPGFQAVSVTNEPRLEGFHAVRKYRRDVLEQTVYDRPDGTRIVLLSAPARTQFRYGGDRAGKTELAGVRCEMLDYPALKICAFFAAGRHYVLICKACTREEAGSIMRQLGASL